MESDTGISQRKSNGRCNKGCEKHFDLLSERTDTDKEDFINRAGSTPCQIERG